MPGLEIIGDQAGRAAKTDRGLRDVVARVGLDLFSELGALLRGRLRADQHAIPTGLAHGFYHQRFEVGENVVPLLVDVAQVRFDVVQEGIFAEIVLDDVRNKSVDGFVIGHAGAERVGQRNVAGAVGIEQAGAAENGVGPEGERVDKVIVDAAINHVDAAQAAGRSHVANVVVDHQIATLDQLDAHLTSQVRVLEIGGVEDTGREQHDVGFGAALRGKRAQRAQQHLGVVLDRAHVVPAEELRKDALHHAPVGEHVAHAAGDAQVVFQHHKVPVAKPDQVRAADGDVDVAGHLQALHLTAKLRARIHELAWYDAVPKDAALVIDVFQKQVQRRDALREAALHTLPLRRSHDAGQQIVREDALGSFVAAVDRERDALV